MISMPLAYLNGKLVPATEAAIPVYDAGFVLGVTVAEQVRTFSGRLFRLDQHLARLSRSLEIVGVDPGVDLPDLKGAASELAARNHALLDEGDDLGVSILVTPGPYSTMACAVEEAGPAGPTVVMHTYPLPFQIWADKYQHGQSLVITDIEQVPTACWPAELKCRSRMHYYLADKEARKVQPDARALFLDHDGHVLEASTANVVIYNRGQGIVSPHRETILPGISVSVVVELAAEFGVPVRYQQLSVDDILQADEVMLCSTSPCVWPVTSLDGRTIADGRPGEMFRKLLAAWSEMVGVDIKAQAERFSTR